MVNIGTGIGNTSLISQSYYIKIYIYIITYYFLAEDNPNKALPHYALFSDICGFMINHLIYKMF